MCTKKRYSDHYKALQSAGPLEFGMVRRTWFCRSCRGVHMADEKPERAADPWDLWPEREPIAGLA